MTTRLPFLTHPCACALLASLSLAFPASAQDFMERSHKQQGPQPEVKPKVDEKAYKAALEKIPVSKEKYDPWGVARPADAKATQKPN